MNLIIMTLNSSLDINELCILLCNKAVNDGAGDDA